MENNFYYIVTSEKTEKILVSKNLIEIFDFIVSNAGSKISKIDYNRKPRILDRWEFLKEFHKNTKNNNKFFELSNILIKRTDNRRKLISTVNLLDEYTYYQQNKNNLL